MMAAKVLSARKHDLSPDLAASRKDAYEPRIDAMERE